MFALKSAAVQLGLAGLLAGGAGWRQAGAEAVPAPVQWRGAAGGMVREVIYSPETRALRVRFATGHVYVYREVSPECCRAFLQSTAKGSFFNRNIRNCYAAERLSPPPPGKSGRQGKTPAPGVPPR